MMPRMDEPSRASASRSQRPDASTDEPRTRGFLFCDLRGYTAFVETHGDRAAAELLGDFRALVRDAVRSTGGGEIRTEGDSFYVVFGSASSAVRCGLAIVEGAGQASIERPERPIRVGVGIHAGEALEEGEGYVGSAVNIAARVCAQAAPGEVLVTDTVRSLVRTGLAVTFRSRGRPRLKGIAEPIDLFAVAPVTAGGAAASPGRAGRAPSRRRIAVVGVGILLVVALAGPLGASVLLRATEASRSPGSSSQPTGSGAASSDVVLADMPGRIAFLSYQREAGAYLPRRQVRLADPEGTGPVLVSPLLSDVYAFRASSDGRRIAFMTTGGDLLVSGLDGSTPEAWPGEWWSGDFPSLLTRPMLLNLETWFGDGSLLVRPSYGTRNWRISATGETSESAIDGDDVAVSPIDGGVVALRKPGTQGSSLWVVPVEGQSDVPGIPLTTGLDAAQPAWSPDGTTIAFSGREPGGGLGIWTVASNGSGLRRLTDDAADKHPSWSPDGRWIVFDRMIGDERRLWIVRRDGTGLTELPLGAVGEQLDSPVWLPSPD